MQLFNPAQDPVIRHPSGEDAAAVWQLVQTSQSLDHNSFYCYFVLCHYFSATCAVAEINGEVAGFVTGFRQPQRSETWFVWQVRVQEKARGHGLAAALLDFVVKAQTGHPFRFIEATISPDNQASQALFRSLAKKYRTALVTFEDFLPAEVFPVEAGQHEAEYLFRLGPLTD